MGAFLEDNKEDGSQVHGDDAPILQTRDYTIFKVLKGNRAVDPVHVKRLVKNMVNVGNLTAEFPIVINEHMEVIDGQHRLQALTNLGWPVGYRVQKGLTLDTVRGINQAGHNWGWRDYANSFIGNGTPEQKDQYTRFMNLHKYFGFGYGTISCYCALGERGRLKNIMFSQGELHITNHDRTFKLLKQLKEIADILDHSSPMFCKAMYKIMNNPVYDHDRMVRKAKIHPTEVKRLPTEEDYMRMIESMYNHMQSEDTKVRLY